MKASVLTVQPSGIVCGLYTEAIPLSTLGVLQIERLTEIEFNGRTQEWEVRDQEGTLLFADPSRDRCLEWEHQQFNQ
jgi:hypothetical protein